MLIKYYKILLNIFFIILLFFFQFSFISALPGQLDKLNFVLIMLIFVLMFGGLRLALAWSLGLGFLLDVYYSSFFGFYIILFFLIILATDFLLNNFFTNRSLYSFLSLILFATLLYNFFILFNIYVRQFLEMGTDSIDIIFWEKAGTQIFLNLIFSFVIFYLINFLSKNFKPVFLRK